jgi:hypothetical protein
MTTTNKTDTTERHTDETNNTERENRPNPAENSLSGPVAFLTVIPLNTTVGNWPWALVRPSELTKKPRPTPPQSRRVADGDESRAMRDSDLMPEIKERERRKGGGEETKR